MKRTAILDRFEIQRITESAILGAFTLREPAPVRAVAISSDHCVTYESRERERIGRVFLDNLNPGTEYTLTFSASADELATCSARTLPRPRGKKRAEFAIIADPHVTNYRENRRGRLFMESEAILRHIVAVLNRESVDFVLMPGDITDRGLAEECALARNILDEINCPVFLVGGDHDTQRKRCHFRSQFGSGLWTEKRFGLTLIGCEGTCRRGDPLDYHLGRKGVDHILRAVASAEGPVILISHRQFVPDDYIMDPDRAYADNHRFLEHLLSALPAGTMAYVGHKNVPALYRRGNLTQLNCPQPVQYPCGFLRVRWYENGMYHNFEPIFSEILNDSSRVAGNALGTPLWEENYRRGRGPRLWNFVRDPLTGDSIG